MKKIHWLMIVSIVVTVVFLYLFLWLSGNKENAYLTVSVGPNSASAYETAGQGKTITLSTPENALAEFSIVFDTESPEGIAWGSDAVSMQCDTDWVIIQGISPGGFVRKYRVYPSKTSKAMFTIEKVLNTDNENILSKPLVFYVDIVTETNQ